MARQDFAARTICFRALSRRSCDAFEAAVVLYGVCIGAEEIVCWCQRAEGSVHEALRGFALHFYPAKDQGDSWLVIPMINCNHHQPLLVRINKSA